MTALAILSTYGNISPANTSASLETGYAAEDLVSGNVIISSATGHVKGGANPAFVEGLVIEGGVTGEAVSFVPAGTAQVVTGYDVSGLTIGDPIYAVSGVLNDADPGTGIVVGRVVYHPLTSKAIRFL